MKFRRRKAETTIFTPGGISVIGRMKKLIFLLSLAANLHAQQPAEPSPETIAKAKYGQMGSYEWSGSISGSYSVANTYSTAPAGETELTQIGIAPILNIFVRNRFYMGGGPNFLYSNSQINVPGAVPISIEQAFLGPQVQMGILWPLSEKIFFNTRALAVAQVPSSANTKASKASIPG